MNPCVPYRGEVRDTLSRLVRRGGCALPVLLLALALLVSLSACGGDPASPGWEYMPDMVHSVAYDSFAPNPVTADRKTLRRPAAGTVPRGFQPFPYGAGPEEAERAGRELHNPFPPSPEVMARGEELFRTFCRPCHGATGQGDGPVTQKFPPPPAYTSTGTRDLPAGRIYHVISRGSGRMPSYASQIAPDDRWRLVYWVQTLQRAPALPSEGIRTAASRAEASDGSSETEPRSLAEARREEAR
jgi:mono/diheme cytochrome c family protein